MMVHKQSHRILQGLVLAGTPCLELQHSGTTAVKLKISVRILGSTLLNYMQRSHILFYWLKGHSKAFCYNSQSINEISLCTNDSFRLY